MKKIILFICIMMGSMILTPMFSAEEYQKVANLSKDFLDENTIQKGAKPENLSGVVLEEEIDVEQLAMEIEIVKVLKNQGGGLERIPVGDGIWLLLISAFAYGIIMRRKKSVKI